MKVKELIDLKKIKILPKEIHWKIFSYMRHNNANILIEAFWKRGLNLNHIYFPKLQHKIWNELRPSFLESNVYGNGMYIVRTKMLSTEKMLLLT